mmetsp:Transcript_95988/g.117627  ORF Transcript_95988/g.117627 Transcript_95988/m.117627 type:complete len:131 (+) Transcript_95988:37-429(+)|eukprot:CAMPEP_0114646856 /NCGR_PEP_ID=MMETSP0191-20121206/5424_1 /TAXON_ID=126664 /ORGANISM="Sorites sp." /LENGTH=130 /DNA_ID=CAMNT_0001859813 /DNA_START=37 /DNA_END=429 /DNA_ORIENTATION=-
MSTRKWKGLNVQQKAIYASAIFNFGVLSFVWVKRQMRMADKEQKEVEDLQATIAEVSADNWSANSKYRCFFAAQQYYLLNSSSPEEETSPEAQKMLDVLAQCREELYPKIPKDSPASRPVQFTAMMPAQT